MSPDAGWKRLPMIGFDGSSTRSPTNRRTSFESASESMKKMSQPHERVCHCCQMAWPAAKGMSIKTLTLSRCIKSFQYAYKSEPTERQTTQNRVGKLQRPGRSVAAQLRYGRRAGRASVQRFTRGSPGSPGSPGSDTTPRKPA